MVNETLARRYATAVYSLALEAGDVDAVGNDLAAVASALGADPLAREFFVAPIVERRAKERVLSLTFGSRVNEIALHALLLLVRKRREALLNAIVSEYRKLQRAARGEDSLTITSARTLPAEELRALVERLERIYGKKFEVSQVVDPRAIGGVRVLVGDRRIDGTVSGRLEALSRQLFAGADV
jgi:F-type H+-transporting ATPase subunit delta